MSNDDTTAPFGEDADTPCETQKCTQTAGGHLGTVVALTPESDTQRIHLEVPNNNVIPIVFLPGIMGSHLRMNKARKKELERKDNRAWRPDDANYSIGQSHNSASLRQKLLDPDTTEVEIYNWTSDSVNFDVESAQDKRHDNVPDDMGDIPPLLIGDKQSTDLRAEKNVSAMSAAQKARWRGWSEVMMSAYGPFLTELEARLNNPTGSRSEVVQDIWDFNYVGKKITQWGRLAVGVPVPPGLTADEVKALSKAWHPVHAMGYNWIRSNGEQAVFIAERIRKLIARYNEIGYTCDRGVILVTHSMGGILARALIHDDYGKLSSNDVLGIVHGAMPTHGAATAYKRIRMGAEGASGINPVGRLADSITQDVLGPTGVEITAIMAESSGALELLPNEAYGDQWLEVRDQDGKLLMSLPRRPTSAEYNGIESAQRNKQPLPPEVADCNAVDGIYTQPASAWWRLLDEKWIDPAKKYGTDKKFALNQAYTRIENAMKFQKDIQDKFHTTSYVFYGHDQSHLTFGKVVWQVTKGDASRAGDPRGWTLLSDDAKGTLTVRGAENQQLTLKMAAGADPGDGTVPAERSGARATGITVLAQDNYDHQEAYHDRKAISFALYGIVKILNKSS